MKVFNTLSGQKEEFQPRDKTVTIYVCGVTVYDDCHIGHAMSYVIFDAVRRYLEFKGYDVKHVQNFTDIDDKIINRANKLGTPWQELTQKYIAGYFTEMDALNIKRATIYPKATDEVTNIIEVIQGLINNLKQRLEETQFLPTAGADTGEWVGTNFERKYIKDKRAIYTLAVRKK